MTTAFIRVINRPQVLALAFGAMVGGSWVALTGGNAVSLRRRRANQRRGSNVLSQFPL